MPRDHVIKGTIIQLLMDVGSGTASYGPRHSALASRAALPLDSALRALPYNNNWDRLVVPIVGLIARFIMPGEQHMGLLMAGVLGIVGFFFGGFIGRLFSKPPMARRSTRRESSCRSSARSSCCLSWAR